MIFFFFVFLPLVLIFYFGIFYRWSKAKNTFLFVASLLFYAYGEPVYVFLIRNLNALIGTKIADPGIALPIGISFFTFQAISYVVDVYRCKGEVQKNF